MEKLKFTEDDLNLQLKVTEILKNVGIPANLKGYHFLRHGIILSMCDTDCLSSVTKLLYPCIAKKFCTTPSRVERAIRHAIEVAFLRGNIEILSQYFGFTINPRKSKATNSEFIATIVDKLRLEYQSQIKK